MEGRLEEAYKFICTYPEAKLRTVVRDFEVSHNLLSTRLDGRSSKRGLKKSTIKFTAAEKNTICRYIDRLDYINLVIRLEFI
ncbi:hypothetical protein F4779DRAFT_571843 [Xylariaceae sp. FL0662B]|nr:hypothetical protein F4779DRAFT_571843 [Xylariaceae sp. FL0662B]